MDDGVITTATSQAEGRLKVGVSSRNNKKKHLKRVVSGLKKKDGYGGPGDAVSASGIPLGPYGTSGAPNILGVPGVFSNPPSLGALSSGVPAPSAIYGASGMPGITDPNAIAAQKPGFGAKFANRPHRSFRGAGSIKPKGLQKMKMIKSLVGKSKKSKAPKLVL